VFQRNDKSAAEKAVLLSGTEDDLTITILPLYTLILICENVLLLNKNRLTK